MFSSKDYSALSLEELVVEEKKVKAQKVTVAVFVGLMVGVAVWSATHKGGFFLTSLLLLLAFWIGRSHSQNLQRIQAEISRKHPVG